MSSTQVNLLLNLTASPLLLTASLSGTCSGVLQHYEQESWNQIRFDWIIYSCYGYIHFLSSVYLTDAILILEILKLPKTLSTNL